MEKSWREKAEAPGLSDQLTRTRFFEKFGG